ncbi:hypothetical protein GY45DRAFT_824374 [Cubamyces sp. BRFM 1775]|nr:hypothetical protein GY45DRAFT_824374 [Cubamyces sp. BRFM 1775]
MPECWGLGGSQWAVFILSRAGLLHLRPHILQDRTLARAVTRTSRMTAQSDMCSELLLCSEPHVSSTPTCEGGVWRCSAASYIEMNSGQKSHLPATGNSPLWHRTSLTRCGNGAPVWRRLAAPRCSLPVGTTATCHRSLEWIGQPPQRQKYAGKCVLSLASAVGLADVLSCASHLSSMPAAHIV